jgi:hypothetical protein
LQPQIFCHQQVQKDGASPSCPHTVEPELDQLSKVEAGKMSFATGSRQEPLLPIWMSGMAPRRNGTEDGPRYSKIVQGIYLVMVFTLARYLPWQGIYLPWHGTAEKRDGGWTKVFQDSPRYLPWNIEPNFYLRGSVIPFLVFWL